MNYSKDKEPDIKTETEQELLDSRMSPLQVAGSVLIEVLKIIALVAVLCLIEDWKGSLVFWLVFLPASVLFYFSVVRIGDHLVHLTDD